MVGERAERAQVFALMVLAWGLSAGFVAAGYWSGAGGEVFAGRDAMAAAGFATSLAALTLIAGIGAAARLRFFGRNIDGSAPAPGSALDIMRRYVSNTTEQVVLFAIACQALAVVDASVAIRLLPVMGVWFVIARMMFYAGYRQAPLWRAVGFAATFHPTVLLFGWVFWRFLS